MYLTAVNLAHYLIARGLVSPGSVVDGDLVIVEAGRRNRNFKVFRGSHPGLFVKQVRSTEAQAVSTIQREAACYKLIQSDHDCAPLAGLVPRLIDFDPARCALVLDLVNDGENLSEHHFRLRTFPLEVGRLLGEALGTFHSLPGRLRPGALDTSRFPRQVPWVLSLAETGYAVLDQMGPLAVQLAAILRQHPDFERLLGALRAEWRTDCLIHGDMKWDNCLIYRDAAGEPKLRIVDWELADLGDASWDVGGVFQTYLVNWILSMPIAGGTVPEQFVERAVYPLEAMQPALRAFWQAYAAAREISPAAERGEVERGLRFGAARMVMAVLEHLYASATLTPSALALLQVSLNILGDPAQAVPELLGL